MKSSICAFGLAVLYLVFLILGIDCTSFGLISPIEVVEEWGCHDTEIRLTCGQLDSKLAILEATFTPNCTDEDCLSLGIKRLTGGLHAPRPLSKKTDDPILVETEAARKFLETLRKSDKLDENLEQGIDDGSENEEKILEDGTGTKEQDPKADTLIANKNKRTSLRASLERLIERYLRKLSPHDNFDCDPVKRSVRYKRAVLPKGHPVSNHENQKFALGERKIILNESSSRFDSEDSKEEYRRLHETRTFCPEQNRRISSLDKSHLEHSYKNESKDEINIRQILNRRCSGRNHCSFIFALDHPYSKVWDSGVVRVKYMCMEDFRMNRYCNEHLAIGHEVDPKQERFIHPAKGEPVAEARIQLQEQSFHSLKILKSGDDVDSLPGFGSQASESRKRKIKIQPEQEQKQAQGVYSQDFKVLKILPSNIDDFNDIEKIGDEIYIRTDDDILNVPEAELGRDRSHSVPVPTALTVPILPHGSKFDSSHTQENILAFMPKAEYKDATQEESGFEKNNKMTSVKNSSQDFSKFENITLIIREGEQYVIKFPNQPRRILDNLAVNASVTTSPASSSATTSTTEVNHPSASVSSVTSFQTLPIFETDERHENATMPFLQTVRDSAPAPTISEMGLSDLSAEASNRNYKTVENEDSEVNSFYDDDDDDGDDESEEFGEMIGEEDNGNIDEGHNRITYTSVQRISYRKPLLHGFSMTPGYPKFYVGDWECKSVISAPIGQRIRVTILDISLRYDEVCKDFLRIVDLEVGHTLFNSCTEALRPIEVISESNQVEVILKSTSKFAFPKRGVLIHYSALGCVDLPPPINGYLVERSEKMAIYECRPSYVFPDSVTSRRQLLCTDRNTWDKILPDCIELAVIGSGIISGLNLNSRKLPSTQESATLNSGKMSSGAANHTSISQHANVLTDIVIPIITIVVLFIINGAVFYYIRLHRNRQSRQQQGESRELAEL